MSSRQSTTSPVEIRALFVSMREELMELRAKQIAANEEIKDIRIEQAMIVQELMMDFEWAKRQMSKKLKRMEFEQRIMARRLFLTRRARSSTQRANRTSRRSQRSASGSRSESVAEPPKQPRGLKREAAFADIKDFDLYGHPDVYGREGSTPPSQPQSAPHPPRFEDSGDNIEDGFHFGDKTPFPAPRSTTSNGSGKKRSRDDIDDSGASPQLHGRPGLGSEPALPFAKRRKMMNGRLASFDEPWRPLPQRHSAHDMDPPSTMARPDTPKPDTTPTTSTSYIRTMITEVVSSVLS